MWGLGSRGLWVEEACRRRMLQNPYQGGFGPVGSRFRVQGLGFRVCVRVFKARGLGLGGCYCLCLLSVAAVVHRVPKQPLLSPATCWEKLIGS